MALVVEISRYNYSSFSQDGMRDSCFDVIAWLMTFGCVTL